MSVRRWAAVSAACCGALLLVSLVGIFGGWTGWPYVPLVLSVGIAAALAAATRQPRRITIAMVVLWAVVACPFPVTTSDGGFAKREPGELQAKGLPALTRGAQIVDAGPIPVGALWLRRADRASLAGESGDADGELVAYSTGWLPYPHLQRTVVHTLGGNSLDDWVSEDDVQLRRDGHRTIVVGHRDNDTASDVPELRPVGLAVSRSSTTWIGWFFVLMAWAFTSPAFKGPGVTSGSRWWTPR